MSERESLRKVSRTIYFVLRKEMTSAQVAQASVLRVNNVGFYVGNNVNV